MTTANPVRIRLRYPDLDTFVEKFAANVTRGGVFLASRSVHPVGAVVPFEIQLMNGEVVLAGQGKVSWVKEYDATAPNRPYGLGVQFVAITAATKPVLASLLRAKEGTPEKVRAAASAGTQPPSSAAAAARAPLSNGKAAAPKVDTSVDLVAEFGLEESAVRRAINRTWMAGSRASDDLADLTRPDPVEAVSLAQALAELPRLLDPQFSRRRASGGLRPLEAGGSAPVGAGAAAATVVMSHPPTGMTDDEDEAPRSSESAALLSDQDDEALEAAESLQAAAGGEPGNGGARRSRRRRR